MGSRYQETPYEAFGAGIDRRYAPDDVDFPSGGLWDALNMVYDLSSDNPEKMHGAIPLGDPIAGTPIITGLFDYVQGTEYVATADDGKIYKRTSGNWSQITSGTGFDTTATTRWYGGMFYGATTAANILVLSNGIDTPKRYNGTNIAALTGAPAAGKFPTPWHSRMVMASGDTLHFSDVNDCENWSTGTAASVQVFRGTGNITAIKVFSNGDLFIFKETAIYRLTSGSTLAAASVLEVTTDSGAVGQGTIQLTAPEAGGYLTYMSPSGIDALMPTDRTGGYVARNIGDPIDSLIALRNPAALAQAWGLYFPRRHEYYMYYPSGTATIPKQGVIANTARLNKPFRFTRTDMQNLTTGMIFLESGQQKMIVGNNAGQVLEMHSGDAWNTENYIGRIYTRAYTQGRPGWMKKYGYAYVSVEAAGSYGVTVRPTLGRRGLQGAPKLAQDITAPGGDGWGVGEWGEAYWGGAALAGTRIKPQRASRGSYLRLQVETLLKDQWFRLNGITIASKLRKNNIAA